MDFNRLIWGNLQTFPGDFDRLPDMLLVPAQSKSLNDSQAVVELAQTGGSPVSVRLLKENSAWVIDEISVRQPDGVVFNVRQNLRREIAQRFLDNPGGEVMRAVSETTSDSPSGVVRAVGESQAPRRGNLTLPSGGKATIGKAARPVGIDLTAGQEPPPMSSDGILRFGPDANAATLQKVTPADSSQTDSSSEEVVYFNGELKQTQSEESRQTLGDISQHPIEIPNRQ